MKLAHKTQQTLNILRSRGDYGIMLELNRHCLELPLALLYVGAPFAGHGAERIGDRIYVSCLFGLRVDENAGTFRLAHFICCLVGCPSPEAGLARLHRVLLCREVAFGPRDLKPAPCSMVGRPEVWHGLLTTGGLASLDGDFAVCSYRDQLVVPYCQLVESHTFAVVDGSADLQGAGEGAHDLVRSRGRYSKWVSRQ